LMSQSLVEDKPPGPGKDRRDKVHGGRGLGEKKWGTVQSGTRKLRTANDHTSWARGDPAAAEQAKKKTVKWEAKSPSNPKQKNPPNPPPPTQG